jgi:hypothetical protein
MKAEPVLADIILFPNCDDILYIQKEYRIAYKNIIIIIVYFSSPNSQFMGSGKVSLILLIGIFRSPK